MEQSQSWGDIMEKEMGDEEFGAEEFKYPMPGANRSNRRQNHNWQRPTKPEGQTFHRRREEAYGQHRWQNQDAPNRALPQRRPPQWQVVADLRNELEGVKVLLKQEKELSKAGRERYAISKTKIQEMEEKWRVEREERLQCDQEIKMLKEQLKHLNPSHDMKAENDALLEKIKVIQKDTFSRDIKTAKQTIALKNKLEEVTQSRQHLASKLDAQEEVNLGLQKELRDSKKKRQHHKMMKDNLQREMEQVRHQHLESAKKDLMLVESLTEEKESLEQEVKVLKEEVLLSNNMRYAEQLDIVQRQLQEKTSSSIKLVSKLKRQKKINYALQKEVEELQKDKEPLMLRADCPQEEQEEVSQPCVTSQEITRLRKVWASESRLRYKRQRRQSLEPK